MSSGQNRLHPNADPSARLWVPEGLGSKPLKKTGFIRKRAETRPTHRVQDVESLLGLEAVDLEEQR